MRRIQLKGGKILEESMMKLDEYLRGQRRPRDTTGLDFTEHTIIEKGESSK